MFDSIKDIHKTHIKRGETKTQNIRRPEIADDVAGDQRLHDRKGIVVGKAGLTAARVCIPRTGQRQTKAAATLFDQLYEQGAQRLGLGPDVLQRNLVPYIQSRIQRHQRQDRRRAGEEPS